MVVLIDANHLASRCFFAANVKGPMTTSKGKNVGLIYFMLNTFHSYIRRFPKNKFYLAWDPGGRLKRHEVMPDYKAGRKKFPDTFYEQILELIEMFDNMGIRQYRIPGSEADDIIGTLTKQARKVGQKVMIISGDHDFEQLITNNVTILAKAKDEIIKDKDYVFNEYGIMPNEIIDMMCLTGDGSDAVNGIPKIANLTAVKLMKANKTDDSNVLDNIINNVDNLKIMKDDKIADASPNIKEKIKTYWHLVERNKKLVRIDCNVENVDIDKEVKVDIDKLRSKFEEYELSRFLEDFHKWESAIKNIN